MRRRQGLGSPRSRGGFRQGERNGGKEKGGKTIAAALWVCVLTACGAAAWGNHAVSERMGDGPRERQEQLQNRQGKPDPRQEQPTPRQEQLQNRQEQPREQPVLSGTIRLSGSTAMARLAEALAEGFREKYPGIVVTVEFTGSAAGIREVAAGLAEIGNVSRELTEEERAAGVTENIVAWDGIAICVDPDNPVEDLTLEELASIYTGEIRNWALVGGRDFPVVVVGREAGSGTRSVFESQVGVEERCVYTNVLDSSGAVMAKVAVTPGAIGYISLETAEDGVKLLKLDHTQATPENVKEGRYPLVRPCVMATKGEISGQSLAVQAWFAYVSGEEGRRMIEEMGLAAEREEER